MPDLVHTHSLPGSIPGSATIFASEACQDMRRSCKAEIAGSIPGQKHHAGVM